MKYRDDSQIVSSAEIDRLNKESIFETPFFNKEENNSYGHFGSVIKEIKDGNDGTHLVKIRPPFFLLGGALSNITRILSGTKTRKILDHKKWQNREISCIKSLYPDLKINATPYVNSILIEKIDGKVAYDILRDDKICNDEKKNIIIKIAKGLRDIHEKDLYHGEPNTQNCIISNEDELYWIDFEIEYFDNLASEEKKANDLEQLLFSILGAFEKEGEIGIGDHEMIDIILDSYGDEEIKQIFLDNPNLPSIAPSRMYQLSFSSAYRFYQSQLKLMEYVEEKNVF
ncbi:MAG: lipopolysaccharide kinase InaA family protein [Candidatus Thermoplasmatota archaeon]